MVMALDGIKVLDLSRLAPGPYASMLLADFGADVTLVEAVPGSNAKLGGGAGQRSGNADRAAAYNALGRGKKSIALNLKDPAAKEIFYEMVKGADVVLEGFRPGVVKRLGVDYETLATVNPRIICGSLAGFGQTGPYRNLVGHDLNYSAIGGALGVTGRPGTPPAIPVNLVADFAGGGLMAAFAICVAIIARQSTGKGQDVDISMSDGVFSLMTSAFTGFFSQGTVIKPGESMLNGAVPWYNTYLCADDRWFSIGSIEPHFYEALMSVIGLPEYLGRQHESAIHAEMKGKLEAIFRTKTAQEWMDIMSQHDICAAPVRAMDEAAADPHNLARQMVIEVDSPVGKVKQAGIAAKLSATPGAVRSTSPILGRDTDATLTAMGFDAAKIAALRQSGTVA